MPKTLANTLLIFALLVIAVMSWQWLDDSNINKNPEQNTVQMAQNETDYYLEGFKITNVNNNKGQVYELSGNSLSHFFDNGNSTIEQPVVQVYSNNNDFWTGAADTGNLSADFSVLELQGDVDLIHHKKNNQPHIKIKAQSITINTTKRQITSDQSVQIDADKWSFKANRMHTDVDNGMLSFDSGVEAQYVLDN